ncbi:MAG TPA: APC family permease [Nocardioides sp.]|uniref:APC family permease n=1 Tax=Nocardioides sp. TaxID=35761 RepID=UPI002D16D275|nr:APC family permease [Nocardioides sp.]HQR26088.1 APC family permease [Nocardioides sp.]
MTNAESSQTSDSIARRDEQKLKHGRLGALAIAFFVVSAVAPLTGMAGGAPFAMLLGNGAGVPAAYLVVTTVMLVFAVGYVAMARHHTSTGAFYSYIARTLGGHAGGAAAWVALLGYNTMQIGLYGLWGVISSAFLAEAFGWDVQWWLLAFIALAIIAVLGYRQIDLSLRVLGILVACEFAIVALFDLMVLVKGGGLGGPNGEQTLSFSAFSWSEFWSGSPAIGLLFAAASFVGFEATTIYSEEAKTPERTVPRATYLAVLTIGIFFMITSWLMVNAYSDNPTLVPFIGGDPSVNGLPQPTDFLFAMADPYIGSFMTSKVMLFLFATSLFAALLAFHNAVARYAYALGREGLVPETLGRTHQAHLSPHMGSISQSILAAVVVGYFWLSDKSPDLQLFPWLTQLGTLAITYLMAFSAIAVAVFFARNPGLEPSRWRSTIAPILAAIGLLVLSVYATSQFKFVTGASTAVTTFLVGLIPVAVVIGAISAAALKRREPEAFAQMGRHRGIQLHE